jgi:glycosyltransferase involved in cell wall biosynthesis
LRILHAPINIANQAWAMAQGLRARGHEVEVWQYGASVFGFPVDRIIKPAAGPDVYLETLFDALRHEFDVVHFHFAQSLVPPRSRTLLPWYWDLPVWRARGTRIVFTFHGSDVRLKSHHSAADEWSFYRHADIPCDEELIAARLEVIRAYADRMTVGSVLDQPYVPEAAYLPKAVETSLLAMVGPPKHPRPVVLHAPSRRSTKGTEFVLAGLEALRQRGLDFDLDLVEGVPHEELLARVASADIVVDKLLGGDAGVSSLEAMALGKVAVARISELVRRRHPDLPVVSADPETFPDVMEELLRSPRRRAELGKQGREYVVAKHDAAVVGAQLEELYAGITPRRRPAVSLSWTASPLHARSEEAQTRLEEAQAKIHRLKAKRKRLKASNEQLRRALKEQEPPSTQQRSKTIVEHDDRRETFLPAD